MSNPDVGAPAPNQTKTSAIQNINRVFIIGAGTMGREIALQCVRHGVHVFLYDTVATTLEQAPGHLRQAAERLEAGGLLQGDQIRSVLERVEMQSNLLALAQADLVIECVPESL